jgi:hypothetical protein
MTDRVQRSLLRRTLQELTKDTASFSRAAEALVRRAERALTLAELGEDATPENNPTPELNQSQATAEENRESATNALAAALVKTSGGDITRQEDLIPGIRSVEPVLEGSVS